MMLRFVTFFSLCASAAQAVTNNCNGDAGSRTPVILDFDMNVDDVVALAYLAKLDGFEIKAVITTNTGFASPGSGHRNILKLMELLGLGHVDVGIGPFHSVDQRAAFPANCEYDQFIPESSKWQTDILYGVIDDTLPYTSRQPNNTWPLASKDIYKKHADAGVTTVITLGPMTSLYDFMVEYPTSYAKLKTLVAMFGAMHVPGNVFTNPHGPQEFNAMGDPHAAKGVIASTNWDMVKLISLDGTNDVPMSPEYMTQLAAMTTPEGHFVSELTHKVRDGWFAGEFGFYGWSDSQGSTTPESLADAYFFWDPLAIAVMVNESWVNMEMAKVSVLASDPPNLTHDGWTWFDDANGRDVYYTRNVSAAGADAVRAHIIEVLSSTCVCDQPVPIGIALVDNAQPSPVNSCNGDAGSRTPVILDFDMNVDDVVALAYLAKLDGFEIKAVITTNTGFAGPGAGHRNILKLMELLGLGDVDVGVGPFHSADQFSAFPANCDYDKYIPESSKWQTDILYGVIDDTLPYSARQPSNTWPPPSKDIYKKHADAGVTTVITLGPMTSLYDFMVEYPTSYAKLTTLYAMFGAMHVPGNVFTNPHGPQEFNVMGDPHGAKGVIAATNWQTVKLISLDGTNDVPMSPEYMTQLAAMTTPEGIFVSELTHKVRDGWFAGEFGFYGWSDSQGSTTPESLADAYFFWDPLAIAVMVNESWVNMEMAKVSVLASDPPNLTHDGWTWFDDANGRDVYYTRNVSAAGADAVRAHIIEVLSRTCITDQPMALSAALADVNYDTLLANPCDGSATTTLTSGNSTDDDVAGAYKGHHAFGMGALLVVALPLLQRMLA